MEERKSQVPVADLTSIVYADGTETVTVEYAVRELRAAFLRTDNPRDRLLAEVCLAEVLGDPDTPRTQVCIAFSALDHLKACLSTPLAQEVLENFKKLEKTDPPLYDEIYYEAKQLR